MSIQNLSLLIILSADDSSCNKIPGLQRAHSRSYLYFRADVGILCIPGALAESCVHFLDTPCKPAPRAA